jgi:hypothetical protein
MHFRRNPLAFKLNALQPEKEYLIEAGKLGAHLKTRRVTLIATCSEFKLHGSKMVVGAHINTSSICMVILIFRIIDGKWVEDDYYEDKALEEATSKGFNAWVTSLTLDVRRGQQARCRRWERQWSRRWSSTLPRRGTHNDIRRIGMGSLQRRTAERRLQVITEP